jgi:hypothetical protein
MAMRTSRRRSAPVRTAAAAALLLVLSLGGAAAEDAETQRLFPRQDGCGNEITWLDTDAGTANTHCYFLNQPVSEVLHQLGTRLYIDYPAKAGLPIALDASRPVSGRIVITHTLTGRGLGVNTVDLELTGRLEGSTQPSTLGAASVTEVADPMGTTAHDFEIALPESLDRAQLVDLSLRVEIRSLSAPHAYMAYNGRSFLDLPVAEVASEPEEPEPGE